MKITCIANQKGGPGKTTSTINLGAGLALKNKKVLLIDLDPQCNLTSAFGVDPNNLEHSIGDVLSEDDIQLEQIIIKVENNLDLAPAYKDLKGVEDLLIPEFEPETRLKRCLEELSYNYDHVIIDCSPSPGILTQNAIVAAHNIIIPCSSGTYAIEGTANMIDQISKIEHDSQVTKNKCILRTQYRKATTKTNTWCDKHLKPYKSIILKTMIRHNEALNQAPLEDKTIFSFAPKSNGAEDYKNLTEEFLKWQV